MLPPDRTFSSTTQRRRDTGVNDVLVIGSEQSAGREPGDQHPAGLRLGRPRLRRVVLGAWPPGVPGGTRRRGCVPPGAGRGAGPGDGRPAPGRHRRRPPPPRVRVAAGRPRGTPRAREHRVAPPGPSPSHPTARRRVAGAAEPAACPRPSPARAIAALLLLGYGAALRRTELGRARRARRGRRRRRRAAHHSPHAVAWRSRPGPGPTSAPCARGARGRRSSGSTTAPRSGPSTGTAT